MRTMTRRNSARNAPQDNITKSAIRGQQTHTMHTRPQCPNATGPRCHNALTRYVPCHNVAMPTMQHKTTLHRQQCKANTHIQCLPCHNATMPQCHNALTQCVQWHDALTQCPNTMRTMPQCPNTLQYSTNDTSLYVRDVLDHPPRFMADVIDWDFF